LMICNARKGVSNFDEAKIKHCTYGTEVGGPREFDVAEGVRVGTNHVTDTDALGLLTVVCGFSVVNQLIG
jgi:hypothetical protein